MLRYGGKTIAAGIVTEVRSNTPCKERHNSFIFKMCCSNDSSYDDDFPRFYMLKNSHKINTLGHQN